MLICVFFWPQIQDWLMGVVVSKPVIEIEEPSDKEKSSVKEISKSVTGRDDKLSLAVFNHVFAERVVSYNCSAQQVNDVYVASAKNVFGDSLKGKYPDLSSGLTSLFKSVLGDENHSLSSKEKSDLNRSFNALAWSLVN